MEGVFLHRVSISGLFCLKQGPTMEGVFLHRVSISGLFCPKQGHGFRPSAAIKHESSAPPPDSTCFSCSISSEQKEGQLVAKATFVTESKSHKGVLIPGQN